MLKRDFLFERGFGDDLPHFLRVGITNHGWKQFCVKPESVNSHIVREFYANIDEGEGFQTIVRWVAVDWSPGAINSLFNHQNFPHAGYNEMVVVPSNDQRNAVVREAGIKGAQWRLSKTEKRTFQAAYLKSEANTWLGFVKLRLLPTTHDSTVSRDRVLMVFAILRSLSIDVGKVIASEIFGC